MSQKRKALVELVKNTLKKSPVVQAMFDEFHVPIEALNDVKIELSPLEVSAKTKDGKIFINEKFLLGGDFEDELHYLVHELTHYLQQRCGEVREYKDLDSLDYLDKPTEEEAFQYQVQFIKDEYGLDRAKDYVSDLLEFHELSGKEAEEKKKKLLGE